MFVPIQCAPGSKLEKDFLQEQRDWAQRCLIEPSKERWKGMPWAQEAASLVEEAFEIERLEAADNGDLGRLAPRFKKLLRECGEDDLIQVLAAEAIYEENDDWRASRPLTMPLLLRAAKMPSPLEMRLLMQRSSEMALEGVTNHIRPETIQACLIRMLSDPIYDEAAEGVLLRQVMDLLGYFAKMKKAEQIQEWLAAISECPRSAWFKKTLEGNAEIAWAWLERGSAYADETSESQWKGFKEHLPLAREALVQAHQMKPDRPEAAASMITVTMGESGEQLEELRHWFDLAIAAQFDYLDAYQAMILALRPRWGGDHRLMMAFGVLCAKTERYDTLVPSRLLIAGLDVAEDMNAPPSFFNTEGIREMMTKMVEGYLNQEGQTPTMRHRRVSDGALAAWLCGDYALAKKALKLAGPKLHIATRNKMVPWDMHEAAMRAEIQALSGEYGPEVLKLAKSKDPGASAAALREILPAKLSPDARAYVTESKMLTKFPKRFQQGSWIPLQYDKHGLLLTSDRFRMEDLDKSLSMEGRDWHHERCMLRLPMTPNFEIRGEFSLDLPEDIQFSADGCGVGLVLWPKPGGTPVHLMFYHSSAGVSTVRAYATDEKQAPPVRFVSYRRQNPFSFRFVDGKVSYDLNGERMSGAFKLGDYKKSNNPDLQLGFQTYRLPMGAKVSFRNLSIRKITARDLEPPIQRLTDMSAPISASPKLAAAAVKVPVLDVPALMIETGKWLSLVSLVMMLIGLVQSRRQVGDAPRV